MFKDAGEKIQIGSVPSGQRYVFFPLVSDDKRTLCFGKYLLLISIQKLTGHSDVNFCQ